MSEETEAVRFLPVIEALLPQLGGRADAQQCVKDLRALERLDDALRVAGMLAWLTEHASPELDALRTRHAMLRESDRQARLRELNEQATMLPVQAQSSLLAINQRIAAIEALTIEALCRDPDAI